MCARAFFSSLGKTQCFLIPGFSTYLHHILLFSIWTWRFSRRLYRMACAALADTLGCLASAVMLWPPRLFHARQPVAAAAEAAGQPDPRAMACIIFSSPPSCFLSGHSIYIVSKKKMWRAGSVELAITINNQAENETDESPKTWFLNTQCNPLLQIIREKCWSSFQRHV